MAGLIANLRKRFSSSTGGYDGASNTGERRRPHPTKTTHEDILADPKKREILTGGTQDLARNFVLVSWALRKHLDFVADFNFQAKTSDTGYNRYLESWWAEQSKAHNFDVAGRHGHRRAVRLLEAGKMMAGDCGWLKLAPAAGNPNRGKIQAIEGDRIAMPRGDIPPNSNPDEWVNGTRVDPSTGRARAYGVCRRVGKNGKKLERIVPARNLLLLANYEFRFDQVRGVSPFASALNWFRDTYESFDYAMAKLKLGQLFGLQITTEAGDSGPITGPGTAQWEDDTDGDGEPDAGPRIDLKKGPFIFEGDPGESASIIESKTPSAETVQFLQLMLLIALRACDIPYSFLDESFTNFYGSRGGLIQYLHACNTKVLDLQDVLDQHTGWRFGLGIEDGTLELPSGKEFDFLKWEHVPGGVPWWNPSQEARGAAMSVAMGTSSPLRLCRETGTVFERNVDETAYCMKYASDRGVPLYFGDASAFAPEIAVGASQ